MLKDTLADLQNVEDKYHEVSPHNLHVPVAPLGVHWAKGVSWRELCAMTTLDQGDLSRWLRRAVDLLRQVANADHVDRVIAAKAVAAANLLDRYPIADVLPEEGKDLMSPYGHDSVSIRDEAEYAISSESGGSEDADEQGRYEKDEDVLLAELQGKVASILNQYNDEARMTNSTGRQDRKNGFERAHSGGSKDPAWLRHKKHKDKKKAHRGEEKKEKEVLKMKDEEEL